MIDKEDILERTGRGLAVFKHYINFPVRPGKNFRNPLYEDRIASCNIYYDRHAQVFKMKDFGNNEYSGDCFWFVGMFYGLDVKRDFVAIINRIVSDLNITIVHTGNNDMPARKKAVEKRIIMNENDNPIRKDYHTEVKPFSVAELAYWQQYGIKPDTLERYNVHSLKSFEGYNRSNKMYKISSSATEPMFAYMGIGFTKVYRPRNQNMRFFYGGEMPEVYCFGLEQLPNKGDMVFITGGEKDVMSLASKGFNAVCFNSETAAIPTSLIEMFDRKFRHIVFLYDMDDTGRNESARRMDELSSFHVLRMELPISGAKGDKDISDYFASGKSAADFQVLITSMLEKLYSQTMMLLKSCEMDYNNPPESSKTVVSVNGVPLGTYDNLLCITGGEGTGKSNFVSALIAGTLADDTQNIDTLGFEVSPNYSDKAVLHYDTEQSEFQLFKNLSKTIKRIGLPAPPDFYHTFYLAPMSRKERISMIRDSMDLYYHRHGGIHLVVLDGIADLIRSANDEAESIAIVDEVYRLAGIYKTCIICVLHFVPNGIKLRGHIGSELQRKAAAILSIEKDENPAYSVVKAIKVRDGSPLDVPMLLFTWDKQKDMHVSAGEKPAEDKEKRKKEELQGIIKEIFRSRKKITYTELVTELMQAMDIKERTAKSYISYMKTNGMLNQDSSNNYQP